MIYIEDFTNLVFFRKLSDVPARKQIYVKPTAALIVIDVYEVNGRWYHFYDGSYGCDVSDRTEEVVKFGAYYDDDDEYPENIAAIAALRLARVRARIKSDKAYEKWFYNRTIRNLKVLEDTRAEFDKIETELDFFGDYC